MSKWIYTRDFAEFTLEQINPSVVKVTYRDQTGYFGIATHWDVMRPYQWTTLEAAVRDDGVDTMGMGLPDPGTGAEYALQVIDGQSNPGGLQADQPGRDEGGGPVPPGRLPEGIAQLTGCCRRSRAGTMDPWPGTWANRPAGTSSRPQHRGGTPVGHKSRKWAIWRDSQWGPMQNRASLPSP